MNIQARKPSTEHVPLSGKIEVRGARAHNLKNVNVDIPRGKFVVLSGVSGSGKSSFAIDTVFAESQRQFLESLSSYARQFVDKMERPDVDSIRGLQPSLCIDQQQGSLSPRSTVGTVTEIYDYFRLLMAKVATPSCHQCGEPIDRQSSSDILESIMSLPTETKLTLLAPMVIGRKGVHSEIFEKIAKAGLVRAVVDGDMHELDSLPTLALRKEHSISAVVDRLVIRPDNRERIEASIQSALRLSNGLVQIVTIPRDQSAPLEKLFSTRHACAKCGISLMEIEPRTFSFNSPYGACPTCEGFGTVNEGNAICPTCHGARLRKESLAIRLEAKNITDLVEMQISELRPWLESLSWQGNRSILGEPIRKEILSRLSFLLDVGLGYLSLSRSAGTLSGGELQRVRLATSIGAGLTGVCYVLDEPSAGLHPHDTRNLIESLRKLQRRGNTVLVVEHDQEIMRAADWIIDFGPGAGANGGTVLVEASAETLFEDQAFNRFPHSVTVQHLSGQLSPPKSRRRPIASDHPFLELSDVTIHNLHSVSVRFPLQRLIGIEGVSGSGKSSLIQDSLVPAIKATLQHPGQSFPTHIRSIHGHDGIERLIVVDQSPIGRSPRSISATYCGFWDDIRKVFASTRDAKQRGFDASSFSFNSGKGRCDKCMGQGRIKLETNFLADVYVMCPQCRGNRFQRSIMAVRFKSKSIANVLDMSVSDATEYFSEIPRLKRPLDCLVQVGLGYMPLGQPATTMSGGESQRVKLAAELSKATAGKTLYVLDEPTTGLHTEDVHRLIGVLQQLVENGNSVIVIEHHVDMIRACDWVIGLGPGAGAMGGKIISQGFPT